MNYNNTIDTLLFLEIIETEGCTQIFVSEMDGEIIRHYMGPRGNKRVQICSTDEDISALTAISLLDNLGLYEIAKGLFPDDCETLENGEETDDDD